MRGGLEMYTYNRRSVEQFISLNLSVQFFVMSGSLHSQIELCRPLLSSETCVSRQSLLVKIVLRDFLSRFQCSKGFSPFAIETFAFLKIIRSAMLLDSYIILFLFYLFSISDQICLIYY